MKENRETSKSRIIFDGFSKYKGEPPIKDILESEPCLLPLLYDILLRLRIGAIAITPEINQPFMQIPTAKEHQNFLRFLWFEDIFDVNSGIIVYRFTRVIFGIIPNPLLINRTPKVHFSQSLHQQIYENFILEKLLRDLYVVDLASCFIEEKQVFRFYEMSNDILSMRGFEWF